MITIVPAITDQKPLVANLIQLYLYDMTESMAFPVGVNGRFEYAFLDRFWRFPYLIMSDEEIAGFALVIDECPLTACAQCFFMAEFFVLKAYRRQGIGQTALNAITARHNGDWHIGVPLANRPAQAFWTRALASYRPQVRQIAFDGDNWRLHAFGV